MSGCETVKQPIIFNLQQIHESNYKGIIVQQEKNNRKKQYKYLYSRNS